MESYKDNQFGFMRYRCQLPTSALTRNSKETTIINLHPAMAHAFDSLANELNVTQKDIINYFMWIYSVTFCNKGDDSKENIKDRSSYYREVVINYLRKDKFNLQKFKQQFEIFDSIRTCQSKSYSNFWCMKEVITM
ncbi:hypothetical protein CTM97_16270 [Photobacterium phosphoreum]|uniref:Uncharacterized protein n=1 Tax=Photobacterium phosphoreum TaxID=659 RepID=A0A2T3JTC8_PHOPO|nr:hypothetical protein [Photobacterium phosphoreum]PSU21256.1 hypothetical protein CTM96_18335 [Photobacterium phosphoreum]PSU40220.1 hypothetical protein CTM97_16270 [Photobacterium phosphoreum]PSU52424.1 hypothetical protein C9J18_09805 [Photobacterium phosphoreum]